MSTCSPIGLLLTNASLQATTMTKTQTRSPSHRPRLSTSLRDVLGNVMPQTNPKMNHAAAQPEANVVDVVGVEVALLATTKVTLEHPSFRFGCRTVNQDKI